MCLARGNPRPPCHSCRGIPAPRPCHSRKGVPAPRIYQREGIPAHPGGSVDPQRRAAGRAGRAAASQRRCVPAAGSETRWGGGCGDPPSRGRRGLRLPRLRARRGAAAPGRRGGRTGGGSGGGGGSSGTRRAAPGSGRARSSGRLRGAARR